ncbi:unnamed protein product [Pleuronectes platessa]|uniref:Trehalase n=1 Tax=Pleuronectes platessa TaxID=8262 RepID=A0A9N7VDW3_PLEPL|nr:unnamed protein product [Pleuronectes platessa]
MNRLVWFCFSSAALLAAVTSVSPPPCDSEIYCTGPILHQVQTAKLFDDDKYFVDMKLKAKPDVVLSAFLNLSNQMPNGTVPPARLREFLAENFEKPGSEFEPWTPPDWHDKPKFLEGIADLKLREWAGKIHHLWKSLGRKISSGVRDHPELYSQIHLPHPFVVPGGRFRELYYWDSYWVVNGLLLSEMTDTASGMIRNFLYLVNRYGFVPNGGRIYYEKRSQPPFLTLMVESYYQATKDKDFLREALPALEQEYSFWMQNRSVAVKVDGGRAPAEPVPRGGDKEQLWMDLKAGAESGWDFSSRWYIGGEGLRDTRTSLILPPDLNALLCLNERTLASFHRLLGDGDSAARYDQAAARRQGAMEALLWDAERGAWFDYSLVTHSRHVELHPSNLSPVWARCYSRPEMGERAVQYLKASGALRFPNGVPTSLSESGQQWDFPNAWPPLQHMLISGLSELPSDDSQQLAVDLAQRWIRSNWEAYTKYDAMFEKVSLSELPSDDSQQLAVDLAQRWIRSNWEAYTKYDAMFEKYDVNGDGKPGGGGEYEVQLGFGWTNGVALQLLDQYGAVLTSGSRQVSAGVLLPLVICTALVLR